MQNNTVDLTGGTCRIVIENIYHLLFDDNIKIHCLKKQIERNNSRKTNSVYIGSNVACNI